MLRYTQAVFAALLLLCFTMADDKDDAKKELDKFQGTWQAVGNEAFTLTIKGNEYDFKAGDMSEKGKLKFDPSKKPAHIDIEITAGMDAGKKQLGIYKWDGEKKVKFCMTQAGSEKRPKAFDEEETLTFEFEKK